ncbi:CPBP family intramembrane metalloprotease [Staphylococcus agnetis]|uniref:CPBP family intramembrane glutamic endopeptidase n=1 Tax=Staphylococcus agnetis TaxID=985762 RepID=UPI000D1A9E68|nr:CPBP family intramembrane glutamic endopeptidase [Staphylococcus agnetis]MCO4327427.1 CPBP family intramembrane metalloprotease [Staphylococcus agnetis]MCO4358335.1 CPBP family intramembrane metalloprotease [Staphylococcus agnetis]MCO4361843.1 CPBP family intramembrane metalloprotease [Staphylococcus agnetis]MCO4368901.1 CPBP family intramembrane metalloprotease [Staphylococcus agnetis]NJH85198.1 CPBP family intramembrane metalloprotease [Staphylococcus agnetis]
MNQHKTLRPAWRDLLGFVIYYISAMVFSFIIYSIHPVLFNYNIEHPKVFLLTSVCTSLSVISFLIWSHRKHLKTKIFQRLRELQSQMKLVLFAYILYVVVSIVISITFKLLPKSWQFDTTVNQKGIVELFQDKAWLPLVFIVLVILVPITEELLFRHVIIGELGKKFGVWVMGGISVVTFAMLHVTNAQSPLEVIPYLVMATLFVIMYIRTNCNIAVSIFLHMLVNAVSFVGVIVQSLA